MAPGLLLLCLCLAMSAVAPVWTLSTHNLTCFYNYNQRIDCEWTSDSSDLCKIKAHKINRNLKFFKGYSSECSLEPLDRPGRRNCSLFFTEKMRGSDEVSLNLSCSPLSQSLVTQFHLYNHGKLDAPGKPVVNGSSLCWAPPKASDLTKAILEYEWKFQQHPRAEDRSRSVQCKCREQCQAELQRHLEPGRRYSAHVRVRLQSEDLCQWSDWGPLLSWESAVGDSKEQYGSGGAALWTTGVVLALFFILLLIMSRTNWVMKLVKGAPVPSPAPSVLKMSWQSPPFSSDSFLTFLRPVDIITYPELIPAKPRSPQSPFLDDKPLASSSPLCWSIFSNPMYSQLCPTAPLLPCSADSPCRPNSTPNADCNSDLQSDMGQVLCPELDMLLLLSIAQHCQGVPVVCEYERVEAVGMQRDRVRLTSVDSGMGSGEEVSLDSLNPLEDKAVEISSLQEQLTVPHTPGSLLPMIEMPQKDCIM
ncbi:uncharacterized protein [Eucyclogobius newberryi]|uniref:uncharacterized protein n=1 Tax=Eucyclogobius newberryi TaxID=166745 RepID=UPI003B5A9F07